MNSNADFSKEPASELIKAANGGGLRANDARLELAQRAMKGIIRNQVQIREGQHVALESLRKSAASTARVAPIVKAKAKPKGAADIMAVYDATGTLVGVIDPADLNPIAAPTAPAGGDAQGGAAAVAKSSLHGTATELLKRIAVTTGPTAQVAVGELSRRGLVFRNGKWTQK